MSPKTGFFAGLGSAFGVFFVIGFFVLLIMVLGGDTDTAIDDEKNNPEVAGETVPSEPDYTSLPLVELSDSDWIRGNKDAKVTIIEYSDIECPYCQRFHESVKEILDLYPNDVNWVYRHLPLPSLHPNSPKDAEAVECVGELGGVEKFWEYLDILYASDLSGSSKLSSLAVGLGINKSGFDACLSSGKYTSKVQSQSDDGALTADVSSKMDNDPTNDGRWGTPFSIIVSSDQKIPVPGAYPIEYLQQVIDSLLQ